MKERRAELAAWEAHNGPLPAEGFKTPRRVGTFLLTDHYEQPEVLVASPRKIGAQCKHEGHQFVRLIEVLADGAIRVQDQAARHDQSLKVNWTFAPNVKSKALANWPIELREAGPSGGSRCWGMTSSVACWVIQSCHVPYGLLEQAPCLTIEARTPLTTEWRRLVPSRT